MNHMNKKKECEELWAKNKYYVLSKSHKVYLEIRKYLKEKEIDIVFISERIQKVRDIKESKKDFSNAILHLCSPFNFSLVIFLKESEERSLKVLYHNGNRFIFRLLE